MKNTLNKYLWLLIFLSFDVLSQDIGDIYLREIWDVKTKNSVEEIAEYLLEPTGYKILNNKALPKYILKYESDYYPDGTVKPVLDMILNISPNDVLILIDTRNKLISFR